MLLISTEGLSISPIIFQIIFLIINTVNYPGFNDLFLIDFIVYSFLGISFIAIVNNFGTKMKRDIEMVYKKYVKWQNKSG